MAYDKDRLDGSDPSYAPGMKKPVKGLFYWSPTAADVKTGYALRSVRLPGRDGDGQDLIRAAKARDLTRELLRWREGNDTRVQPGTWQWIIGRYKSDDFSPIHDVKANTRAGYLEQFAYWENAIGTAFIAETDFAFLKTLQRAMQAKGRSEAFIHRKITHLRILANYGLAIDPAMFGNVCQILSVMRVSAPKPKSVSPTEAQVTAIIAQADDAGDTGFALGLTLMWWLTLRAVDVRGQTLEKQWQDGLTWNDIDLDAGLIRKTPSKTKDVMPEVLEWDVSMIPTIMDRLRAIPKDQRIGPVIRNRHGQPYTRRHWAATFAKHREAAGVPDIVKAMDTRAGAITHAKGLGASHIQLQHQANHREASTTDRYIRGRNDSVNKVIQLRNGTKSQPA